MNKVVNLKITDTDIYQTLFKAIYEHHLLPDTHLPESEIASSFNVSRTRIRKVLEQLIHEQLVVRLPNKGCFVASMSNEQVHEVFAVRQMLEVGVIDALTFPLKSDALHDLEQLCADENLALQQGNYSHAHKLSGDFHIYLALLTDNETLISMIKQLIARSSLAIAIYSNSDTMHCDSGCHHQLRHLFSQSDKQAVKDYMVDHLQKLEQNLLIEASPSQEVNFTALFDALRPTK